jgi:hypothetical protein
MRRGAAASDEANNPSTAAVATNLLKAKSML